MFFSNDDAMSDCDGAMGLYWLKRGFVVGEVMCLAWLKVVGEMWSSKGFSSSSDGGGACGSSFCCCRVGGDVSGWFIGGEAELGGEGELDWD